MKKTLTLKTISFLSVCTIILDGTYPGYDVFFEPISDFLMGGIMPIAISTTIVMSVICGTPAVLRAVKNWKKNTIFDHYARIIILSTAPLVLFTHLSLVYGVITGGDFRISTWQVRMYVGILFWTIAAYYAIRRKQDVLDLSETIYTAIRIKAILFIAIFITYYGGTLNLPNGTRVEYLSSHSDSLHYGIGVGISAYKFLFDSNPTKKFWRLAFIFIIAIPLFVNERRVAIVGLMMASVLSSALIIPTLSAKIRKKLPIYAVIFGILGAAFWFSPLNPTSSITETDANGVRDYRDLENYNLYNEISNHYLLGTGLGRPFTQYELLPDIIKHGEFNAWVPHNNFLMTWAFTGFIGVVSLGIFLFFSSAITASAFIKSPNIDYRIPALMGLVAITEFSFYTWGDMGLNMNMLPCILIGSCTKLLAIIETESLTARKSHA